uniref:P/Homo B domain-containing protein n=1 Tax=Strongyloides stercoralis TaxID=6248 RepID=A0A0K0E7I3_STRER
MYFNSPSTNYYIKNIPYHISLLIIYFQIIQSIQHDSECLNDSTREPCINPIHTILTLKDRDDNLAKSIAQEHGMYIKGQPFLGAKYFLEHKNGTIHRKKRSIIHEAINRHHNVVSITFDNEKKVVKRGYLYNDNVKLMNGLEYDKSSDINRLQIPSLPFTDPLYKEQWYLIGKDGNGYDMNIQEAWLMGYSGKNVTITILDDGIQIDHPDLLNNYDPMASIDVNDGDDNPTPSNNSENKHGTRCAGEVAAVANNNECGVGVAYKSNIGGIRMLDGPFSDAIEAAALSFNQNHIDIYSASWGPADDGKTFDGPGPKAREAIYNGIKYGRNGKGNIFVWASGNGGFKQDSCSADGYITSIYTLSISSATYYNSKPWYLEECPSIIATTHSSSRKNQPGIITTDAPNGCTKAHSGTSASAPIAAGIIALALEANPSLTWRDIQHIVLRTANPIPLLDNPGWSTNGVGRKISNQFGYGLMDAGAIVKLSKVWTTVPEQRKCIYKYKMVEPRIVNGNFQINFTINVNDCPNGDSILYLEHVQVISTIKYSKRGDLKLTLLSPSGTKSIILPIRSQDDNKNGINRWPFLTVQMWGEDPRGEWILMIESLTNDNTSNGTIYDWDLLLYGTDKPVQPSDLSYLPKMKLFQKSETKNGFFESVTEKVKKFYQFIQTFLE